MTAPKAKSITDRTATTANEIIPEKQKSEINYNKKHTEDF